MKPDLSIIITTFNEEQSILRCLTSLSDQHTNYSYEILVIDSSKDSTVKLIKNHFPNISVSHFSERKYCGEARNIGIRKSKSDLVAFIDADCEADSNWVHSIITAHCCSHWAIGGSIANPKTRNVISWAAYFCEFRKYMPHLDAKLMKDMAGANISYKKQIFEHLGPFIINTYGSDTEFHWRMLEKGKHILFDPKIKIVHHSIDQLLPFISHEFVHGQHFATVRSRAKNFSKFKRYLYSFYFYLIPFKMLIDILYQAIQNFQYFSWFLFSLPILLIGLFSWSLGECTGYFKSK